MCCQIRKAVHIEKEFGIDLSSLPVIYSDKDEYCPKIARLCNPFGEPLTRSREDLLQINFWFEQPPAISKSKIQTSRYRKQKYLLYFSLFQLRFLRR